MMATTGKEKLLLKAPFPYFGGKRKVAHIVWSYFGNVDSYVEPFAGSLAVLLGRPHQPQIETVNDKDCYISNAWRAIQYDPEAVAYYADYPVNEADLHARHLWLVSTGAARIELLKQDPDYFDAKVAGWWLWGLCCWIGGDWCKNAFTNEKAFIKDKIKEELSTTKKKTHTSNSRNGVHRKLLQQRPVVGGDCYGLGVHRKTLRVEQKRIEVTHNCGVLRKTLRTDQTLPNLMNAGRGINKSSIPLYEYMQALSDRLRYVRICCGDYKRVLKPAVLSSGNFTGIFLDPPYDEELRDQRLYKKDSVKLSTEVRDWCIENGDNPKYRIALCGYAEEHQMPETWRVYKWSTNGGYANFGEKRTLNKHKETIWFSPSCLDPTSQLNLFDNFEEEATDDRTEAGAIDTEEEY